MDRIILALWIISVGILDIGMMVGLAAEATHHLSPTPRTVTWGYFDSRTPAVLKVRSGDTVEIESLIAVKVEALEAAGLQRAIRGRRKERQFSSQVAAIRQFTIQIIPMFIQRP